MWYLSIGLFLFSTAYLRLDAQFTPQEGCVCVKYFNCLNNGSRNIYGAGVIDIRLGDTTDNPCHYLEVCCGGNDVLPDPVVAPLDDLGGGTGTGIGGGSDFGHGGNNGNGQGGNDFGQGGNNGEGGGDFGQDGSDFGQGGNNGNVGGGNWDPNQNNGNRPPTNGVVKPPYVNRGCGIRHSEGVGFRITGNNDHESQFGEFPWMVAVLANEESQGEVYLCGGSLIHPKVVLTAAHCIKGKSMFDLSVRVGEWDTQTTNEPQPHENAKVALAVEHPRFHPGALHNDFALLVLQHEVTLAENIDTICLPSEEDTFDNTRCVTTGWGKDVFGDRGLYQTILKSVEVPTVPNRVCQNALRKTRLSQYFQLHDSFMCAGGEEGIDACTGDGGSPLVCPMASDPSRYVQAGIVAWGIGCGQRDVPGVYANVAKARPWIDEQLRNYNLDLSQNLPLDSIRIKPGAQGVIADSNRIGTAQRPAKPTKKPVVGSGNPFLQG